MFEPGTRITYSNTGIDIGAAIVEVITGMKWEDYLKQEVLDPLDMKSTWFWPTDKQLKTKIELYETQKDAPAKWVEEMGWQQRPYNDSHVFASAGDDFDNGCTDIDTCIGVCDAGTRFEQDRRGCCNGSYLAKRGTT